MYHRLFIVNVKYASIYIMPFSLKAYIFFVNIHVALEVLLYTIY